MSRHTTIRSSVAYLASASGVMDFRHRGRLGLQDDDTQPEHCTSVAGCRRCGGSCAMDVLLIGPKHAAATQWFGPMASTWTPSQLEPKRSKVPWACDGFSLGPTMLKPLWLRHLSIQSVASYMLPPVDTCPKKLQDVAQRWQINASKVADQAALAWLVRSCPRRPNVLPDRPEAPQTQQNRSS